MYSPHALSERSHKTDPDLRIPALASSVIHRSTSRILRGKVDDDRKAKHSPDAEFVLVGAGYLGVVIETSFSQKRKDLSKLAEDYILGSVANVSVVTGGIYRVPRS